MKKILQAFCVVMPWGIKRRLLRLFFGYQLHPTAYIGFSWIFPKDLTMNEHSTIGHLNVALHLDRVFVGANSSIGRSNWITGFPSGTGSGHFVHQASRKSELRIGRNSAITKNHHLDCTNTLSIGDFTTIAGYQSQFLTHSIDVFASRQDSKPILIGNYCFVSTNVTVLGGAKLPDYSVLGAKSLLNKQFDTTYCLYGGVPSVLLKKLSGDTKYFSRSEGFVI